MLSFHQITANTRLDLLNIPDLTFQMIPSNTCHDRTPPIDRLVTTQQKIKMHQSVCLSQLANSSILQCKSISPTHHQHFTSEPFFTHKVKGKQVKTTSFKGKPKKKETSKQSSSLNIVFKDKQSRGRPRTQERLVKHTERDDREGVGSPGCLQWLKQVKSTAVHKRKWQSTCFTKDIKDIKIDHTSPLITFYSQNVFPQNKFKRFSNLLKQRYLATTGQLTGRSNQTNTPKECHDQESFDKIRNIFQTTPSQQKQDKLFIRTDCFSPKVQLKKRPSSGVPLKKHFQSHKISKTLSQLSQPHNPSLEMNHIQALQYRKNSSPVKMEKTKVIKETKDTYFINRVKTEPLSAKLQHIDQETERQQDINPWEGEHFKEKSIQDIEVCIRQPY